MSRDRLLAAAKASAINLTAAYVAPQTRTDLVAPSAEVRQAIHGWIDSKLAAGERSEYDAVVARSLARILLSEDRSPGATVTEEEVLEAERNSFVQLCQEPKTAERITHTLKTGKPLRN
jgi:3-hydroxyacyl-CoA dehydrogenase